MVQDRITQCFERLKQQREKALVTYIMASDPDMATSEKLLCALPDAGADIVELGMPFSEPMADGPTIQRAAERSLKAGGSVRNTLKLAQAFRNQHPEVPLVLMGYYNPIYHYGVQAFVKDALAAGVDGVIIVDLPPEEEEEFTSVAQPAGLALVRLTTPTTDDNRAPRVLRHASGFVYYISITGITGTASAVADDISPAIDGLRKHTKLPIVVGFGIKTPEQASALSGAVDGIVVGSAIVQQIEQHGDNPETLLRGVTTLVGSLKAAI